MGCRGGIACFWGVLGVWGVLRMLLRGSQDAEGGHRVVLGGSRCWGAVGVLEVVLGAPGLAVGVSEWCLDAFGVSVDAGGGGG